MGRNTLPVCRNQCCLSGGSQEHLSSEDCQTSLDADVSCSQLSLLLLLHHLPALLYLFFGKLTSNLALPLLAIVFTDTFEHKPIYPIKGSPRQSWILDDRFWISDTGFQIFSEWKLDSGFKLLVGFQIP